MDAMAINISDVDLDRVADNWEELVSAGVAIVEEHDRNRWKLGELGHRVTEIAKYGEAMLKDYASAVRVRGSTMYEYVKVRRFYPKDFESDPQWSALSWSHFQQASRLADLEAATAMLIQANDENMSVDATRKAVNEALDKPASPAKVIDEVIEAQALKVVDENGEIRVINTFPTLQLDAGTPYRVVVYEVIK